MGMGIVLALGSLPATASVITLNPAADAFVSASNASNNYGAAGALSAAASGLAKGEFQSYMKFDTSSAKSAFDSAFGAGNWTVQSVTLQLTAASPNNPIFNSPSAAGQFSVTWIPDDSWTEGTGTPSAPGSTGITFSAQPSLVGAAGLGTFSYGGATSGQTTYTLSLASGFAADVSAGNLVSLHLLAADSSVSYVFNSVNNTTAANRPLLSITALTPEPATFALLAVGTLLLASGKRGKRS
jgi:hypothetical protein